MQCRLCLPVALTIVTLIGVFTSSAAWSQAGQTIRLILPFPPGGPADIMARLAAQQVGSAGLAKFRSQDPKVPRSVLPALGIKADTSRLNPNVRF
jgi:hypothetical protein